ncbi:MAG: lasso peptide biosynthesis PqqD family chaperone [Candidatus Ozemobacteraceae bacterium]
MKENTKIRRNPDLVTSDLDGEVVMMNVETGKYYNLGKVGGKIWALLEKEITFTRLIDALMDKYDVERAKCESETTAFLQMLAKQRLILVDE